MLTTVGQSWSEFGCENININHHDQSYAVFHKWNLCLDNTDKSSTQASILWGVSVVDVTAISFRSVAIYLPEQTVHNSEVRSKYLLISLLY